MATLYERIKERREALQMTQEELALKLGYKTRSSINKIEKGENDIPQSKIEAFAIALDTTPAYLMGWTDAPMDDIYGYRPPNHGINIDRLEELENLYQKLQVATDSPKVEKIMRRIKRIEKLRDKAFEINDTKDSYYLDNSTALLAQEIYENKELGLLLDASRKLKKEDLEYVVNLVERLKGNE